MTTRPALRQARGEERIEQILRATLAVIARDGAGAVTYRSVAAEAELPLGSLTYYFSSKQELLREALRLHVSEDADRLHAVAADLLASGADGQQVIDTFADVLEASHGDIAQFELYLEAARDPELGDVAAESLRAYEAVAVLGLRAAGVPEPERTAALLVATIDGLSLHRRAAPGATAPMRLTMAQLLRALSAA